MTPDSKRLAQALLGSMARDAPAADAKERALAAFGVVSGVTIIAKSAAAGVIGVSAVAPLSTAEVAATASTSAATGAVAAAGTTAVAGKAATLGVAALTKALLVGAIAGGAVVYGGSQISPSSTAHDAHESTAIRTAAPSEGTAQHREAAQLKAPGAQFNVAEPPAHAASLANDIPPPPLDDDSNDLVAKEEGLSTNKATPPARAALPPASSHHESATAPPIDRVVSETAPAASTAPRASAIVDDRAAPSAALTNEIHRLDRARLALRTGASTRALQEIAAYEAEFPTGTLLPEATVLHVEILMQMGNEAQARAIGSAFASAHPTSGHVPKILRLLAGKRAP